jgi:WD40 repeat protein
MGIASSSASRARRRAGSGVSSTKVLPELTAGIISALAFSPHQISTFAAGSFAGSVVLYDEDTGSASAHVEGVEGGGVTQIAFHPLDPSVFFVASRRSKAIQAFDMRDLSAPVGRLERSASTNQRLTFDVDLWGRWLASGDEVSCRVGETNFYSMG